jgi:hypothetical protein
LPLFVVPQEADIRTLHSPLARANSFYRSKPYVHAPAVRCDPCSSTFRHIYADKSMPRHPWESQLLMYLLAASTSTTQPLSYPSRQAGVKVAVAPHAPDLDVSKLNLCDAGECHKWDTQPSYEPSPHSRRNPSGRLCRRRLCTSSRL